jgi:hypothetical protein
MSKETSLVGATAENLCIKLPAIMHLDILTVDVCPEANADMSGAHLGPVTNFSFFLKFPLDSCGVIL